MVRSYRAIMASIFAELPSVQTSLILFDTQVVDLSGQVGQPVDILPSNQLGGGTDITRAKSVRCYFGIGAKMLSILVTKRPSLES